MLIERTPVSTGLILLSIILVGVVGCAPQATQPVDLPTPTLLVEETQPVNQATPTLAIEATQLVDQATATPLIEVTLPSGWEMYTSQGQCGYSISHPQDMDITSMVPYSWSINFTSTGPSGPDTNFVYVSVIPGDFQDGPGVIYNYDPAEMEFLLNMQVGESRSMREGTNLADTAPWFTYTRLPDTTLSNQTAPMYENTQPWEFPLGTKEIRYYLQANGCTYMIGGYMTTVDSGEPRAISQELFDQIIATFRVNS